MSQICHVHNCRAKQKNETHPKSRGTLLQSNQAITDAADEAHPTNSAHFPVVELSYDLPISTASPHSPPPHPQSAASPLDHQSF